MSAQQIYTSIDLCKISFCFSCTFQDQKFINIKQMMALEEWNYLLGLDLYNKINLRPKENGFVWHVNSFVLVSQSIDWVGPSLSWKEMEQVSSSFPKMCFKLQTFSLSQCPWHLFMEGWYLPLPLGSFVVPLAMNWATLQYFIGLLQEEDNPT